MVSRSLGDAISLLVQPLTAQFVNSIVNTVLEVIADEMKLLAAARRPRAVKATRTTEAVKATTWLYLEPVAAFVGSFVLFGVVPLPLTLLGGAAILIGALLTNLSKQ